MNARRCLKIAKRMHDLLVAELGQGIDPQRMIAESLYARDVLLVCDAFNGHDLARLARLFRTATSAPPRHHAQPAHEAPGLSAFLGSIFGPPSTLDAPGASRPPQPNAARGWLGRARRTSK